MHAHTRSYLHACVSTFFNLESLWYYIAVERQIYLNESIL